MTKSLNIVGGFLVLIGWFGVWSSIWSVCVCISMGCIVVINGVLTFAVGLELISDSVVGLFCPVP